MGNVIGIDLGTTNTAVSVVTDGRPRILEDAHGYKVVPSVVWVGEDGTVKVGQQCKSLLITDPTRTAFAVKRILGRHFASNEVNDAHARVGYNIGEADDGGCLVELESGTLSPVEVSAHILRTAKDMAERALGASVDEAVITVPAYFNHAQRSATLEAAQQAGLRCERLLNEPTAAALAYGFRKEIDRTLLVFDLGGGTFDVSVLRLAKGVYEILSTLGDSYLGGEDFDHRVVDWLADRFLATHGVDLRTDRTNLHRLKEAAEKAKCELSFTESVDIRIPHVHNGQSIDERLDRSTLIELVQDYVDRSLDVTLSAVTDAELSTSDIDEVILVGGQTRMPAIRDAITNAFGKEPSRSVHPEEVVAMGAAVHAASLESDSDIPPAVLIDVTPFDLGIDVASGMFQPIIVRNSTIPASASRVFATAKANQSSVQITVRQGASRMASDNEFLGEFVMSGLTPAPRMETKVEVNFQIDSNGMLRVTAMEPATGKQTEITVRNFSEVAVSKGAVSPDVRRAPGADSPDAAPSGDTDQPPAEAKGKKNKVSKKKKKKTKSSSEGGGLLGALFGRMSKTRTTTKVEPASPEPEATSGSIIDQVVAEREAAQADAGPTPTPVEAIPEDVSTEPEAIQMPDIDPSALEALEPDMDEPVPIQLPDLSDDSLEEIGVDALQEIGSEDLDGLEDLEDLEDLEALEDLEDLEELGDDDILTPEAPRPASVDTATVSAEASVDEPVVPVDSVPADAAEPAEPAEDTGSSESEEDRMERQREELMARLSHPLDEQPPSDTDDNSAQPIAPEEPAPPPVESTPPPPRRKPARLKLSYKNPASVVREYGENLQRGGCFIKTSKPLAVGREVLVEVRVPAIADNPISIPGIVTWSSRDLDVLESGQDPGMGIEYILDDEAKAAVQDRLALLG